MQGGLLPTEACVVAETNSRLSHPGIRPARRGDRPGAALLRPLRLLKPSGRSDRGYRLYRDRDLARLEQIVVLKFLGLPLGQIGRLLKREAPLGDTLRRQQQVLAEKRRRLDMAIRAIGEAERSVHSRREPGLGAVQNNREGDRDAKHCRVVEEVLQRRGAGKVEARKVLLNPELQAQVTKQWTELVADVEAALGEDPAGPNARALAARWRMLVEGTPAATRKFRRG
jgi:DNA-binding transcriptional MerR regulator